MMCREKDTRNRKWKRNAAEKITHSIVITSGVITQQIQLICSCILRRMSIERVLKVVCRYDFVRQVVRQHHLPFIKLDTTPNENTDGHFRHQMSFDQFFCSAYFPFFQVYVLFLRGNKSQKEEWSELESYCSPTERSLLGLSAGRCRFGRICLWGLISDTEIWICETTGSAVTHHG